MKTYFVVTGIVQNPDGKTLLLKKSEKGKTYPHKWSFCSGNAKEHEAAEDAVLREIKEETQMDATIKKQGNVLDIVDEEKQKRWIIATFLCTVQTDQVTLCEENTEYRWINLEEISNFDTVPGLVKDLKALGLEE